MLSIPPYQVTKAAPRVRNGRSDFAGGYFLPASPALPDWGLEPAASSWIRLGLTTDARQEHHLHLHPREEREPKKSRNNVESESPEVTTIMIWNVPHSVYCEELRSIFEGVNGIVAVYYSSLRRLMLVDFVTRQAARKAHNLLRDNWARNNWLRNYKLNTAFFRNKKYVFDRYSSLPWARSGTSVCIQGLDSSLHVDEIRTMLAGHFGPNNEGIRIPTKLDGSSIGKAYIKYGSWCYFSEALNLNGLNLRGQKLRVTECDGGSRFWDGHITPNGPGTGKRKVFEQ